MLNTIQDAKLEENIEILLNRDDISDLLKKFDLFLLPSRYEGLPLVILEAMASGLAIIGSDIAGCKEVIRHNENGLLFKNEDHHDLANKILYLYNNRENIKILAQDAFKHVQQFDISAMSRNYENLYNKLIGNKRHDKKFAIY